MLATGTTPLGRFGDICVEPVSLLATGKRAAASLAVSLRAGMSTEGFRAGEGGCRRL